MKILLSSTPGIGARMPHWSSWYVISGMISCYFSLLLTQATHMVQLRVSEPEEAAREERIKSRLQRTEGSEFLT